MPFRTINLLCALSLGLHMGGPASAAAQEPVEDLRCFMVEVDRPEAIRIPEEIGDTLILRLHAGEDLLGIGFESGRAYFGSEAWDRRMVSDSVSSFWYEPAPDQLRIVSRVKAGQIIWLADEERAGIAGEVRFLGDFIDHPGPPSRFEGRTILCNF